MSEVWNRCAFWYGQCLFKYLKINWLKINFQSLSHMSQAQKKCQPFLLSLSVHKMLKMCAKTGNWGFLLMDMCDLRQLTYRDCLLRLAHHFPCAVPSEQDKVSGCCFGFRKSDLTLDTLHVCLCVSFLHSITTPSRSSKPKLSRRR